MTTVLRYIRTSVYMCPHGYMQDSLNFKSSNGANHLPLEVKRVQLLLL